MIGCISIARRLLPEQVPLQNAPSQQGTGHTGRLHHWEFSPSDKIIQGCFSKMWQLIPTNNTWIYRVEVHMHAGVCACKFLQRLCVHMCWGRCECLCVGHKRKVNTVHASPVVTPASANSHSSHLAAEKLPFNWLLALCCWILTKQKGITSTLCYPEVTVSQLVKCGKKKIKKIQVQSFVTISVKNYDTSEVFAKLAKQYWNENMT